VEEAQAKAKAAAADRAAAAADKAAAVAEAQRQKDVENEAEKKKKAAAKQAADRVAKEHIMEAQVRLDRLEKLQQRSESILASPDPSVKKIRVDIKLKVRSLLSC
jgi:hypothetical protein